MWKILFFSEDILCNGWFYISVLEFIIIVVLLIKKVCVSQNKQTQKREILSVNNVDYDNIIQSSFKSQSLYDILKKKCHPDRFLDSEQNMIATELFAKIVENKYNYQALLSIKEDMENKLKLKI